MPNISAFDPDRADGRTKKRRAKPGNSHSVGTFATSLRVAHGSARVTSMFAAAVLAAVVTGIVVNALALQKGRHPAPFFGRSFALPDSAPSVVPTPPVRPAAMAAPSAPAPVRPQSAAAPIDAGKPVPASDPIGQLIKGGVPAKPLPTHAGRTHAAPAAQ